MSSNLTIVESFNFDFLHLYIQYNSPLDYLAIIYSNGHQKQLRKVQTTPRYDATHTTDRHSQDDSEDVPTRPFKTLNIMQEVITDGERII